MSTLGLLFITVEMRKMTVSCSFHLSSGCSQASDSTVVLLLPWESLVYLVHEKEGAEVRNKAQTAVGMTEKALEGMTLVNLFNFIPEYTEYIGLESLVTNLNLL